MDGWKVMSWRLKMAINFAYQSDLHMDLEPNSDIVYKCSEYYMLETEDAVQRIDSNIGIDWPAPANLIFSN
jgi:hypothetical protein